MWEQILFKSSVSLQCGNTSSALPNIQILKEKRDTRTSVKSRIIYKHWQVLKMLKTVLVQQNVSVAETYFSDSHFLIYLDVNLHRVQEPPWLWSPCLVLAHTVVSNASKISAEIVEAIDGHLIVKSPIIYSNKYFRVIILFYYDLAPFIFFLLPQPWAMFYPSNGQGWNNLELQLAHSLL